MLCRDFLIIRFSGPQANQLRADTPAIRRLVWIKDPDTRRINTAAADSAAAIAAHAVL